MKCRNFLLIAIFFIASFLYSGISVANAQEINEILIPTFPKCENPQGTIKVEYREGTHGIPGDTTTYTGSDAVYFLSETTLTQCFCSINENGIQTNWWRVSSLSIEEIEVLIGQGWIYIPDGSLWGLDEAPYLAHNRSFDCEDKNGGGGTDKDDNGDDDDGDDDDEDEEDGEVLGFGTGGQVLGLAKTGNITTIYLFLAIGLTSLALLTAVLIKSNKNKE